MSFTVQSIKNRAKKSIIIFVNEHILDLRVLNLCVEIGFKRRDRNWFDNEKQAANLPYLISTKLNIRIIKIMICI